jgi:hypothetical protein
VSFAPRRCAAAASDAGHRARLGNFMQVPPLPSPRAQPRSFYLPCFLSRVSCPGRCAAVAVSVASVAVTPTCAHTCPHAHPCAHAPAHACTPSEEPKLSL